MSRFSQNHLVSTHLPAVAAADVSEQFTKAITACAIGDLYKPALNVSDAVFPDADTARMALRASVAPGAAVAVRIGNERCVFEHPQNADAQKSLTRLTIAKDALNAYLENIHTKAVRRYSSAEGASLKRCPGCASRINMHALLTREGAQAGATPCPVCQAELVCTDRDIKKIEALTSTVQLRTAQLAEARAAHYEKLASAGRAMPEWLVLENRPLPLWLNVPSDTAARSA